MTGPIPTELAVEHLRMTVLGTGAISASQSVVMTEELALVLAEHDRLTAENRRRLGV